MAIRGALLVQNFVHQLPMLKSLTQIAIFEDNPGCISIAKHNGVNERGKHIDIQYQMIMEKHRKDPIVLGFVPTGEMLVNMFIEAWDGMGHQKFRKKVNRKPFWGAQHRGNHTRCPYLSVCLLCIIICVNSQTLALARLA